MHTGKDKMQSHAPVASAGAIPAGTPIEQDVTRRGFLKQAAAVGGVWGLNSVWQAQALADEPERLKPIGEPQGIHPGRVVWVHDPQAIDWKGPGDGHWYDGNRTKQERVDEMLSRAILELTGETSATKAWDKLFRHLNQARGKGDVAYKSGEKIVIKPNWVGMIWTEGTVNLETYTLIKRQDYMNTSPQMILALIRSLVEGAGVEDADIAVCDSLAYLVHEYYAWPHRIRWQSIRWASISSGRNTRTIRGKWAWMIISTRRPWRPIRPPARSTTRTTPRRSSDLPASGSTSTGTIRRKRNTHAIWEPVTGLNWWRWLVDRSSLSQPIARTR
ncbi:MAG: twin-arginine translocation signal domain-containing protein [Planctomycetota bacterium]|nr:twin-arginine translocation signal domain-containing protein [Planctomycetota bacterium]